MGDIAIEKVERGSELAEELLRYCINAVVLRGK